MGLNYLNLGAFFLLIFLSGFWLSRAGKPHAMALVTVHKLIGLAAGIYLGVSVYRLHQAAALGTAELAVVGVTALLFAVNVTTGSLLSTERAMPEIVSVVNRWFPYLTLVSTGMLVYLTQT